MYEYITDILNNKEIVIIYFEHEKGIAFDKIASVTNDDSLILRRADTNINYVINLRRVLYARKA